MWKECNIHLLSSNESNIVFANLRNILYWNLERYKKTEYSTPYHLYITDDSVIKEGDWCYHFEISQEYTIIKDGIKSKSLHPAQGVFQWKNTENEWYKKAKKIIATTDESLVLNNNTPFAKLLPNISQDFLKVYVEEYNKGNKIEKVLVEFEEYAVGNYGLSDGEPTIDIRVKLSPTNEVYINLIETSIVHQFVKEIQDEFKNDTNLDYLTFAADRFINKNKPVEEKLYNREEVIKFAESFARMVQEKEIQLVNSYKAIHNIKWIKENLK